LNVKLKEEIIIFSTIVMLLSLAYAVASGTYNVEFIFSMWVINLIMCMMIFMPHAESIPYRKRFLVLTVVSIIIFVLIVFRNTLVTLIAISS
jgi:hypothetical protein